MSPANTIPDHVKQGAELEYRRRNPETGQWYKMPVEVLTDPVWSNEATGPGRNDGDWIVQVKEKYPPESRPAKVFDTAWASRLHEPEYIRTVTQGQELRQRMRTDDGTLRFGKVTAKGEIVDHKVLVAYQTKEGVVERTLPHHFLYAPEAAEKMLQRVARSRTPNRGYYSRRDQTNYPSRESTTTRTDYATTKDVEEMTAGLASTSDLKTVAGAILALTSGKTLTDTETRHLNEILTGGRKT